MTTNFLPNSVLKAADLNAAFAHHADLNTSNTFHGESTLALGSINFVDNQHVLQWTNAGGTPRLRYVVGGLEVMSFRDSGNIHCDQIAIAGGDGVTPPIFIGPYVDGDAPPDTILVNHDYNSVGIGGTVTTRSTMRVVSDVRGSPDYFVWSFNNTLNLYNTGGGQNIGYASSINRYSGASPAWLFYGQHRDFTGLPAVVGSQQVASELDLAGNGPEATATLFAPQNGSRAFFTLVNSSYTPPVWVANRAYALGDVITASPNNGFTYIAQNAGTSGATQPTWPTSAGTVVNGAVTWAFGTTIQYQISRALSIGANLGSSFGAAIFTSSSYYDAILEFSYATLDTATNANAAAIRLAPNMPIDFSGGKSLATQNLHTLRYDSAAAKLIYAVAGVAKWSIDANGNVRAAGTFTGSVTP